MNLTCNEETNNSLVEWLDGLKDLSWSCAMARPSAETALTEAHRLGIPFDYAARHVFEFALEAFFQSNPDLPFVACPNGSPQATPQPVSIFRHGFYPTRNPVENLLPASRTVTQGGTGSTPSKTEQ